MSKEQKFWETLGNLFVGEKIEGESGYINLMRIKFLYYTNGVFPQLQQDIEKALKDSPNFREELFQKLYDFFHRYFSKSGSIYFRYTPLQESVYEKVYTDDRDVILFWKTHMLYYVKTDRLFRSMGVEVDGYKFSFDVSTLEHKRANEKRNLIYTFKERQQDGTFVFKVTYSEKGKKTNMGEIRQAIKEALGLSRYTKAVPSEETLERAFRLFERQNEVDYFINKNAKAFLEEQFDLWMYQYVFKGESQWTENRIQQLQALRNIAFKIIAFISQFEDELVKIWNKPKFVLNSNYVITLDRIAEREGGMGVVEKLLVHENFPKQVEEWRQLGIVDDTFTKDDVLVEDQAEKRLTERYKHLPIDTKYFKDLELEILGLFDNLDQALDGWLIKSENYQALNTILPKFRGKVQTIYIDPPFNKEQDADYFYSVKYKDATWISLLENRLRIAKDILKDTGSIFVRCDYNGNMYVRLLMNEIFGGENFRNEIHLKRTKTLKGEHKKFHTSNDSLYFYCRDLGHMVFNGFKELKEKPRWVRMHLPGTVKGDASRVVFGRKIYPPPGRKWVLDQEGFDQAVQAGLIKWDEKSHEPLFLSKYRTVGSDWTDVPGYTFAWDFPTENSEALLRRVIASTSHEGDLVMDFFLGSGTTTAVAHKLKRKWIGVEMGEHFYTVVLPRMKKVLAYDKSGISKEEDVKERYNENKAGGFFKYYELEQYEDVLRKAKYEDANLFDDPNRDPYHQYVFLRDLKMLGALEVDAEKNAAKVDLSKLYENIDIAETLSNLTGKWIKRISADSVEFEDGEVVDTKNLDWKLIKPLIWW